MSGADHTPWLMLKMENPEKNIGSAGEKKERLWWLRFALRSG